MKSGEGVRPNDSLGLLRVAVSQVASSLAVLLTVAGCASLAVRPCDTIADRDGKYFGRFFLGVATLGLSEVTIQQEEIRQAYEDLHPACESFRHPNRVRAAVSLWL